MNQNIYLLIMTYIFVP